MVINEQQLYSIDNIDILEKFSNKLRVLNVEESPDITVDITDDSKGIKSISVNCASKKSKVELFISFYACKDVVILPPNVSSVNLLNGGGLTVAFKLMDSKIKDMVRFHAPNINSGEFYLTIETDRSVMLYNGAKDTIVKATNGRVILAGGIDKFNYEKSEGLVLIPSMLSVGTSDKEMYKLVSELADNMGVEYDNTKNFELCVMSAYFSLQQVKTEECLFMTGNDTHDFYNSPVVEKLLKALQERQIKEIKNGSYML